MKKHTLEKTFVAIKEFGADSFTYLYKLLDSYKNIHPVYSNCYEDPLQTTTCDTKESKSPHFSSLVMHSTCFKRQRTLAVDSLDFDVPQVVVCRDLTCIPSISKQIYPFKVYIFIFV